MRDILANLRVPESPPLPPKKRWGKPALLLLGGAVIGAAPFLFHIWGGQQSRKLSFEHALSIAKDPSSPLHLSQPAWVRVMILGEDGLASLLALKKQRPTFLVKVQSALNRLSALLNKQQLTRKSRPNTLSYADALSGIADPGSGLTHVGACLDLIAFDIEEATRGLILRRQKGGEPGEAAAIILSRLGRFLQGN